MTPTSSREPVKPVFDAVNDAVSALSEMIRSLRAAAREAKRNARARPKRGTKSARRASRGTRKPGHAAKRSIKSRLEKAWEVLAKGEETRGPSTTAHSASGDRQGRMTHD